MNCFIAVQGLKANHEIVAFKYKRKLGGTYVFEKKKVYRHDVYRADAIYYSSARGLRLRLCSW